MINESVETILAEFRSWLISSPTDVNDFAPVEEPVDLHTLVSGLIALRQEVNLQTRSSRSQLEQNNETLQTLSRSLQTLETVSERQDQLDANGDDEAVRPLLKTLVDLRDILSISGREIRKVGENIQPALQEVLDFLSTSEEAFFEEETFSAVEEQDSEIKDPNNIAFDEIPKNETNSPAKKRSWWDVFWSNSQPKPTPTFSEESAEPATDEFETSEQKQEDQVDREEPAPDVKADVEQAVAKLQQMVDSLITGYSMSVQRIERALEQQDLERIPTVGEPFDPEIMEVVDVITDPELETTEVIEEVRPGYMRNGRVFRYAQVKVARPG